MARSTARSPEARKVLRELDKELASSSARLGQNLEWGAAERAVLGLIASNFDRIADLRAAYEEAAEVKVRVTLSTELRLLETAVARLLRQVRTDIPAAESQRTVAARRAANARWDRDAAS